MLQDSGYSWHPARPRFRDLTHPTAFDFKAIVNKVMELHYQLGLRGRAPTFTADAEKTHSTSTKADTRPSSCCSSCGLSQIALLAVTQEALACNMPLLDTPIN